MNSKIVSFLKEVNVVVSESQRLCYLSIDKELQIEKQQTLLEYMEQVMLIKEDAINAMDEDSANAALCCEDILKMLISQLKMWISFKEEDAGSAWTYLINAQDALRAALQAHKLADNIEPYSERLHLLERLLFPPMKFLSTGMIIDYAECSICGKEYGECNHIKGKVYLGRHCVKIIKKSRIHEVSVVDEPANKHCRITSIGENGQNRDILTWRIIETSSGEA